MVVPNCINAIAQFLFYQSEPQLADISHLTMTNYAAGLFEYQYDIPARDFQAQRPQFPEFLRGYLTLFACVITSIGLSIIFCFAHFR